MRPVWLCPLRLRGVRRPGRPQAVAVVPAACRSAPTSTSGSGARVHVGDDAPNSPLNRAIEDKVSELDGHKSLYSEAFYDPATFDRLYDGANLAAVKKRYDPEERLTSLYDKAVRQTMTQMKDQPTTLAGTRLNLAEIFETLLAGPVADPVHGVRRQQLRPRGRTGRAGPEERARPRLPGDRPRRPGHGARLRLRRPRPHRRAPGDPYDGMVAAAAGDAVPSAVAGRGAQPAALHRAEPDGPAAAAAAGAPAALAPDGRGLPAQPGARRQGDPAPLRRLQPVLRDGARPVDDLHLRALPDGQRDPRGGAARQVRPGRAQARPPAGPATPRRRLRLGRDGAARRPGVRRPRARRDPLAGAGRVGPAEDQGRGARPPRRGAAPRLPRRAGDRLRRGELDRPDRAHRGRRLPGVLPVPARQAGAGRAAAQPLHHPAGQPADGRPVRSSTATCSPTAS